MDSRSISTTTTTTTAIMSGKHKASLISSALIGAGVCFVLLKTHGRAVQQGRSLAAYLRDPLRKQTVQVVNTVEECQLAIAKLRKHCSEYRVLGFDCEWVTVNGSKRPVALLQLAAHNGYCALIRLCRLRSVPSELRELLENNDILKVGVVPLDDAKKLARDYGVCVASTLDLRHMARHFGHKPEGLAKMALQHLHVTMDKDWRISCSNWEGDTMTPRQIDYAAKDALVAVELYRHFVGHRYNCWFLKPNIDETVELFANFFDVPFSQAKKNSSTPKDLSQKQLKSTVKTPNRTLSTRSSPLYENCFLQAPDGQLLCTCDKKKAEWYILKEIGELVAEDPYTVRLKFEPAGRAVGEVGKFYQQEKANRCVVCGSTESYQRKNIIPREYRKFFPTIMKDHTSHDILLLCPPCHQRSNISDLHMRHRLARLADAPFTFKEGGARLVEQPNLRRLKSAAKALHFNGAGIPAERCEELRDEIRSHFPDATDISDQLIKEMTEIETHEVNNDFFAHGEKVVGHFQQHPESGGLVELERMWRTHFLTVMAPKFLPDLWSVDHNVHKLEIRVAENRITENEVLLSGLKTV